MNTHRLILVFLCPGLSCWPCFAQETLVPGAMVVAKQDMNLKFSGKIVGQVKEGEYLQVREVRGAWVDVGKTKPGWVRIDQLLSDEQALAVLNKMIEKNPRDAAGYIARAKYFLHEGEVDEAEANLHQVEKLDPKNSELEFLRSQIFENNGDYAQALQRLNRAIEQNGLEPEYYRQRAVLLREQRRIPEAIADYEKLIALKAADANTYNSLAWWYATSSVAGQRNAKKAVKYALQACELTGYTDYASLDTLAAAYAESGEWEKAIDWQEKAIEQCEDYSQKQACQSRLKLYKLNQPYREDAY